jgi:hypothetical protein
MQAQESECKIWSDYGDVMLLGPPVWDSLFQHCLEVETYK